MRTLLLLWLFSLAVVAAASATITALVIGGTTTEPMSVNALPWTMGVIGDVQRGPGDSTHARDVFFNLPVSCGVFSPSKAILTADEVFISRVPDTRRDVDAEFRGNVHLRYTVLHD